jgi:hypothetical protein
MPRPFVWFLVLLTAALCVAPAITKAQINGDDLSLTGSTPSITMDDTDSTNVDWIVRGREEFFQVRNEAQARNYLYFDPLLRSTAVGYGAIALDSSSFALGVDAVAIGIRSLAVGRESVAGGFRSTALGDSASSPGSRSTALGPVANSSGENSTAIGYLASAPNPDTIILGEIPGVNFGWNYTAVGMGTTDPLAPLHVFRDDATQEMLFLESNQAGTVQDRAMIQLVNNGGIRFQFDNPVLNTAWRFQAATGNQDNFEIAKVGTGEIEFRVDADGNAYVAGLIFENSDVNAKTNITPVNPDEVLKKVTQLPIKQWAYKESPHSHHIGPMAQDFRAAFGTGETDTSLATMDVGGVAIASIQALNQKLNSQNAALEDHNRELEGEVSALREELDQMKAMMMQLLPQTAQN